MSKYLNLYILPILLTVIACNLPSSLASSSPGKIWAFLVAGSEGYWNYRHQADICHAFQILKNNGIPEENIIVMMADDIAHAEANPTPGIVLNELKGSDVYKGVLKDYTGKDVTIKNFLHVLKGNETGVKGIGSGRVIKSGPDDFIFVNFVDHGAPGALCFIDDELYATDLYDVLKSMADEKKFNKMVMYVEACYSGSMFDDILEDNSGIFVMAAADPRESSYACYYDTYRETYLGDVFSVNWMHQAEIESLNASSLHHLFEKVRTNTTTSHVEEYGDLDSGNMKVSNIFKTSSYGFNKFDNTIDDMSVVKSADVPIAILKRKIEKAENEYDRLPVSTYQKELRSILKKRKTIETVIEKILFRVTNRDSKVIAQLRKKETTVINRSNMDCCKEVSQAFSNNCFKISKNPYVSEVLHSLLNTCNLKTTTVEAVVNTIKTICPYYM